MQRFIYGLGWFLIASAGAVLFLGPVLPTAMLEALKNALPAGLLVALAGNLLTQGKNAADTAEKRSLFYLESAGKAYEQARSLLVGENNDRATWIEAARCLGHAQSLAGEITVDAHRRVLELNSLKYRSFFQDLLASKPATFFYGVSEADSLDAAARGSTAGEERNGRITTSTLKELDEASIRAVWEAAKWPENYQDPMGSRFDEAEVHKLLVLFPELHRHLEHRRQWRSASGQLYPRRQ